MFRSTTVLALLLVSAATANGPPPWHFSRSTTSVFEFPDDGISWSVRVRLGSWNPSTDTTAIFNSASEVKPSANGTVTINHPEDFNDHQPRFPSAAYIGGRSKDGVLHILAVPLTEGLYPHTSIVRGDVMIRRRVEWTSEGIRLTVLEERRVWRPVTLAYILAGVSVVYALGLWLFLRHRRKRLARTDPPVLL